MWLLQFNLRFMQWTIGQRMPLLPSWDFSLEHHLRCKLHDTPNLRKFYDKHLRSLPRELSKLYIGRRQRLRQLHSKLLLQRRSLR